MSGKNGHVPAHGHAACCAGLYDAAVTDGHFHACRVRIRCIVIAIIIKNQVIFKAHAIQTRYLHFRPIRSGHGARKRKPRQDGCFSLFFKNETCAGRFFHTKPLATNLEISNNPDIGVKIGSIDKGLGPRTAGNHGKGPLLDGVAIARYKLEFISTVRRNRENVGVNIACSQINAALSVGHPFAEVLARFWGIPCCFALCRKINDQAAWLLKEKDLVVRYTFPEGDDKTALFSQWRQDRV